MSAEVTPNRVGPFPFPKKNPEERKKDFSEVQIPYTRLEVIQEAQRCLLCGTPVCMDACPVQMDVRGMCESVSRGDFKTAFTRIRETNALPGVTARCCPQLQTLCENACVMRWEGQAISIGMIQRFCSDWEMNGYTQSDPATLPETGKHVSIIGAGPTGLAAASLLRRYGHAVTIYEELPYSGGTPKYGIPDYHLPKEILQYEIERIQGEKVEINTGVRVGQDVTLDDLFSEGSDAILITTGSKDVNKLGTPGIDLAGVYDGYGFLQDVFGKGVENYPRNPKYELGNDVLVIGAGDTALDDARVAKRLTHGGNVTIVYRRSESEANSDPIMVDEAKEEGIEFQFLTNPKQYNGKDGKLVSTTMDTMQLGEPDSTGRKTPESIPGMEFEMKCSAVLLAVGRGPNSFLQKNEGLELGNKDSIAVDDHFKTSMRGVFAAGDVTTGETLVVKAMGSGRNAAQRVHEYLMNLSDEQHVSLYERYYIQHSFEMMVEGKEEGPPPA
ncbi:MAG: NAD(P)-dependent oxidoreductase [Thaumarchaeota archaeon]|nr:NAD(P)-dependent oxidoreductase [Nitrososphaerota archaeon]